MGEWNLNFTYGYYRELLTVFRNEFECTMFSEVPRLKKGGEKPYLLLRHDIDVDPVLALKIAEIENEFELRSTYFIMLDNPVYKLEDAIDVAKKLLEMGNEIGLHFSGGSLSEVEHHCEAMESVFGCEVNSVSFHRPRGEMLNGELYIGKRINAYARELMQWYISDSKGRFRSGEPLIAIRERRGNILQILIHPIWWGETHAPASERIIHWFNEKTKGKTVEEKSRLAYALHLQIQM
jgi:hypothetical protein